MCSELTDEDILNECSPTSANDESEAEDEESSNNYETQGVKFKQYCAFLRLAKTKKKVYSMLL